MRKARQSLVRLLLVAVLLSAGAVFAGQLYLRWKKESLSSWIGRQLVTIVNGQIVPDFSYDQLTYTAPWTVSLHSAKLTAPDGTEVFTVGRLDVTLAERPTLSKPIVIQSLSFVEPALNLIQEPDGGLRGLYPFVESKSKRQSVSSRPDGTKNLSDVLKLNKITITRGSVSYFEHEGADPWVFDDLSSSMTIENDSKTPGWYGFSMVTGVDPGLRIDSKGRLNLDSFILEITDQSLSITLDEITIASLPRVLKVFCQAHTIRGKLTGESNGTLNLGAFDQSSFDSYLKVTDFNFAFGEFHIPADVIAAQISFHEEILTIKSTDVKLLGGEMKFGIGLDPGAPDNRWAGRFNLEAIDLDQLLRQPGTADKPSKLDGYLSGNLNVRVGVDADQPTIEGDGALKLREGRLWKVPFFSSAASLLDISTIANSGSKGNARGDTEFLINDDGFDIKSLRVITSLYAAKGSGTIGYDGALSGSMNAGVLVKIGLSLGPIGSAFNALTDNLVKYKIGGTLSKPTFSTRVLGLGG